MRVYLLICLCGVSGFSQQIFFKTNDDERFFCESSDIKANLSPDGKLASIMGKEFSMEASGDGSEKRPYVIYANGKLIKKYLLPFLSYGQVRFAHDADAFNTLQICQELGFGKMELYIARLMGIPTEAELKKQGEIKPLLGAFVALDRGAHTDLAPNEIILSGFEVGETVVTQTAFTIIMGKNPSHFRKAHHCPEQYRELDLGNNNMVGFCHDHPVENVTWYEAQDFITELNRILRGRGHSYFLLSYMQSRYVLNHKGTGSIQYLKDHRDAEGNFRTLPVHAGIKNELGVRYCGVSEWVQDWSTRSHEYRGEDPEGAGHGINRAINGYSVIDFCTYNKAQYVELEARPKGRFKDNGFRIGRRADDRRDPKI